MKIIVMGSSKHGKDTTSTILKKLYGLDFISSSLFALNEGIVQPYLLNNYDLVYYSKEACYNDRHNHQDKWFKAISEFNIDNPTRLGNLLFSRYDIYCGLRNVREFQALKAEHAFDCCLWVDRSHHAPVELTTSFNIGLNAADYIIDNNGTIEDLEVNILEIMGRAMDDRKIEERYPNILA